MDRSDIDRAVVELDGLLATPATPEDAFQSWAERHPAAFKALGYRRSEPHPRLHRPDGDLFIPDFMCETNNGLWEIVELKTAEPFIYKEKDRRATFYQPMTECIAQCNDYSNWLSQQPAKGEFEAEYRAGLSDRPGALIIAGGRADYDRQAVAEDLGRRTPPMRLHSWPDVLNMLMQFRSTTFGAIDGAVGCHLILLLRIERQADDTPVPLIDIGVDELANRLTLSVSNSEGLLLHVLLANGSRQRVAIGPTGDGFQLGLPILLEVEVASTPAFTRVGVDINHREAASLRLARGSFELTSPFCMTLGASMDGGSGATFFMFGSSAAPKPIPPIDAARIARFLEHLACTAGHPVMHFARESFMYTQGHPCFGSAAERATNLIQHSETFRPRILPNPEFVDQPLSGGR